jgi:undecaprenyl-diphosphatase
MIMHPIYHMTYLQAIVIGLVQGLTELFPVSSLGHTVLVPAWLGGTWGTLVRQESRPESPYLAFIVGLHLATALVLLAYYWRTWQRIAGGLFTSIRHRRIDTDDQRLAWLLVIATIPVGIAGLALEHAFRVLFAKPLAAAIFLTINGGILFLGEHYRRRDGQLLSGEAAGRYAPSPRVGVPGTAPVSPQRADAVGRDADDSDREADAGGREADAGGREADAGGGDAEAGGRYDDPAAGLAAEHRLAGLGALSALWIGSAQILALFAGISREGVTMAGGLIRGLSHQDAMRFSFLLSTPVILAAGALKLPDLAGPLGSDIRGQVIAGSVAAAASSLFAVVFLARYFRTRTLTPFAVYCVAAGVISIIRFAF